MTEETKSIYEFVRFKHLNIHTIINHLLIINLHHVYIYIYVCINDTRYLSCANHVWTIYIYIYTHVATSMTQSLGQPYQHGYAHRWHLLYWQQWSWDDLPQTWLGCAWELEFWEVYGCHNRKVKHLEAAMFRHFWDSLFWFFGMVVSYHHMIKRARVPLHDSKNPKCFENWNMHIHANAG